MLKLGCRILLGLLFFAQSLPVLAVPYENIQVYGANWVSGFFEVASDIFGDQNHLFVSDLNNSQIQVFNRSLEPLYRFGGYGQQEGNFIEIHGIFNDNEDLFVTSIDSFKEKKGRIQQFGQNGLYIKTFESPEKRSDFIAITKTTSQTFAAITEGSISTFQNDGTLLKEVFTIQNVSFLFLQDITAVNNDQFAFIDRGRRGFFIANSDLTELRAFGEEYISIPVAIGYFQQRIYIADANGELFCFSLNGKLIKSIKTNLYINGLLITSPNEILATSSLRKGLFQIDWNTAKMEEKIIQPGNELELHWPSEIWVDSQQNIYVNDDYTSGVKVIDGKTGLFVKSSGFLDKEGIQVSSITGTNHDSLYMLSSYNSSTIYHYQPSGEVVSAVVNDESKLIALVFDEQENLYALDAQLNKIWKLDANLQILDSFPIDLQNGAVAGLFINHNLYISTKMGNVMALDKNSGQLIRSYSFEQLRDNVNWQHFVLYQDYIIFSDRNNHCLQVFTLHNEAQVRLFGWIGGPKTWTSKEKIQIDIGYEPGKFLFPEGLTYKDKWLYVADSGNHRIQKIPIASLLIKDTLITLQIGQKTAYINNKKSMLEEAPFIRSNRTYVPLRFLAEAFQMDIQWIGPEQKIILKEEGVVIELWINRSVVRKNGQETRIDAVPLLIKSRTYVPIRFVAEALDARVEWESKTQTVIIRR
ncbi:MAG: stalk domain-containing protein [Caldisericia bacterium]|nr:stalk domain-containing protein [Caldisericia bacterium]